MHLNPNCRSTPCQLPFKTPASLRRQSAKPNFAPLFRQQLITTLGLSTVKSDFYASCYEWTPFRANPLKKGDIEGVYATEQKAFLAAERLSPTGERTLSFETWLEANLNSAQARFKRIPGWAFVALDDFCAGGVKPRSLVQLIEGLHERSDSQWNTDYALEYLLDTAFVPVARFVRLLGNQAPRLWPFLKAGGFEDLITGYGKPTQAATWYCVGELLQEESVFNDLIKKGRIEGIHFRGETIRDHAFPEVDLGKFDLETNTGMLRAMRETVAITRKVIADHLRKGTTVSVDLSGKSAYERIIAFFALIEKLSGAQKD